MLRKLKPAIASWNGSDNGLLYFAYIMFLNIKKAPLLGFFKFIFIFFYSYYVSYLLVGFSLVPRVIFTNSIFRVKVERHKSAKVVSTKKIMLRFESWGNASKTTIVLSDFSELTLIDTFTIGDGCKIQLETNSRLQIGGDASAQLSGVTCNTIILCSRQIDIGSGVIISWGCYISDSSQHKIFDVLKVKPVTIGEHVWISEGVSIGPGCKIGQGSIVGSKSLLSDMECADNSLVVGCPGRVVKTGIVWSR